MGKTDSSPKVTGVTYRYLQTRCAAAGVSLTKVCEAAGIVLPQIQKWREKDPKSIETLRKLEAVLEQKESETRAARVWELTPKS